MTDKLPGFNRDSKLGLKDILLKYRCKRMAIYWRKQAKKSHHRYLVLKQWVATQKSYISDLQLIINQILGPMIENKLLTMQQRIRMFPNLEAMIQLSEAMVQDMSMFVETWDPHKTLISTSVIYLSKFFKVYKQYCNNYLSTKKLLTSMRNSNPKVFKSIQISLKLDLDSYFIKPVQRPPKYKLLLRQYQKAMRNTHADYEPLSKAIDSYHDVVQENNYAMELQEKNQKLIRLDQTYGDIIVNTRVMLGESIGNCIDGGIRIYIFNDLVLATKCIDFTKTSTEVDISKQGIYLKIYLDGFSFVRAPRDGKYITNRLAITGKSQTLDISFQTIGELDRCYKILKQAIQDIYQKQKVRNQLIQENQTRRMTAQSLKLEQNPFRDTELTGADLQNNGLRPGFTYSTGQFWNANSARTQDPKKGIKMFSKPSVHYSFDQLKFKWVQPPIYQRFNLQFRHIGTEKRFSGTTIYYVFFIQTAIPVKVRQYVYLQYNQIQELHDYLKQKYQKVNPSIPFPPLQLVPNGLSNDDSKNNEIKLIEFRAVCLQRFLNFIFRCEKVIQRPQYPCLAVFLDERIWAYLNKHKYNQKCTCVWCRNVNFDKDQFNIDELQKIERDHYQCTAKRKPYSNICLEYLFNLQTRLAKETFPKQNLTLQRVLLIMNLRNHRLIAPYNFPFDRTISKPAQLLSLPIHLINRNPMNPDMHIIDVPVHHNTTVRQILQGLAIKLKISTLRDFELCLKINKTEQLYHLDQDQYITQVATKGNICQNKEEIENNRKSNNSVKGFFRSLSSTFQQLGDKISDSTKIYFYLKKAIVLSPKLQLSACHRDPQRLILIVGQIFHRYKLQKMALNFADMKLLCAVYYILTIVMKGKEKQITSTSAKDLHKKLDIAIFKELIPDQKWYFMDSNFCREIAELINKFRDQNLIQKAGFQKLHLIVYEMILQKNSFCAQFIEIENVLPHSLPGQKAQLLAGVNRRHFVISRFGQLAPLIQIRIDKVSYKVSGTSMFLNTGQREHHFRSDNMFTLEKYIKMYKSIFPLWDQKA